MYVILHSFVLGSVYAREKDIILINYFLLAVTVDCGKRQWQLDNPVLCDEPDQKVRDFKA